MTLDANPERDAVLRAAADRYAQDIWEWLQHIEDDESALLDLQSRRHVSRFFRVGDIAFGDNENIGHFDFEVVLVPEGSLGATSVKAKAYPRKLLLGFLPDETSALSAHLQANRYFLFSILVHELTHLFDMQRAVERDYPTWAGRNPRMSYWDDPLEHNAFFQQGVAELLERLENDRMLRVAGASFEVFRRVALENLYLRRLDTRTNAKVRKKFHQRLYQTWRWWRDALR